MFRLLTLLTALFYFSGVSWLNASQELQETRQDLLELANGTVLLSATSEYDARWAAMMLIEGTNQSGWCSAKGAPYPNTFLFELPETVNIDNFVIDNSGVQESGYPGISARKFSLAIAENSSDDSFETILEGEAAQGERNLFSVTNKISGRFLKLTVESNWGNSNYTEIMELAAFGTAVDTAENDQQGEEIEGVYSTNYDLLYLRQSGETLDGCYDWDNGRLAGTTDGRTMQFQWTEDNNQTGSALIVVTADRKFLNGLWYENGVYQGLWFGTKVTDSSTPKCRAILQSQADDNPIGRSLDNVGRAIMYGIYFDHDSDEITDQSLPTLHQLLAAIRKRPGQRFVLEGHTDSTGTDKYNTSLSTRRAHSVAKWLIINGVNKQSLSSAGYGESQPVADNSKPDGRALNRRVEVLLEQ